VGQKKVILDTNIYISALATEGNEREVLRKCIKGELALFLTNELLTEIERVLEYPKFNFSQSEKDSLKLVLAEKGNLISANNHFNLINDDPSDNKFLDAAFVADAGFLVTGDKHLLKLKQFANTEILRAAEFLKQLK
jgi:putative PIN family toxin of toxin-antitoxin system